MTRFIKIHRTRCFIGLAVVIGLTLFFESIFSQEQRNNLSLSKSYTLESLKNILIAGEDWHPFPTAEEHETWMSIPESARKYHIIRGEKALGYDWQSLPATLFLEFVKNGNRTNYETRYLARRRRLSDLVIAECIEGKGRFIDEIVNGVWAVCEESHWGFPAQLYMQKMGHGLPDTEEPIVDLFVAETASLLAWTYYLLGSQLDTISPLIRTRIQREVERRVLIPCLKRNDFWWMGFKNNRVNNWNPWCNSNWLTAVLLLEQNETRRISAVYKIMKSLDRFISGYPPDGSCDEGPVYWNYAGGALFDGLELLYSATNGTINFYNEPLIKEIGRYIYRVHIYDGYFINFADASAKPGISADLFNYGRRIGDKYLTSFGAYVVKNKPVDNQYYVTGNIVRKLRALFSLSELLAVKPAQPLMRDIWLEGIQVMAARSQSGSAKGLYVAAKGGNNGESHNHNDVGNFIVYADGRPMIIDIGVGKYTAKTFGKQRYEIWTMQSAYHNLPTINGVMQKEGRKFIARNVAYKSDESSAQLSMDIAGAYPHEANLGSWIRTVLLNRGKNIIVRDSYKLAKPAGEITLTLMTPCEVTIDRPGLLTLKDTRGETNRSTVKVFLYYDADKLTPSLEKIPIEDARLKQVWDKELTRIILLADNPKLQDTWKLRITQ